VEIAKVLLFIIAIVAVVVYVAIWAIAYHHIPGIEKWSKQYAALSPWWVFDSNLLPQEHDHLRKQALLSLVVCVGAGGAIWLMQ
jgi:hypothetical protein